MRSLRGKIQKREKEESSRRERGPGEDLLDLKACEDVVTSKTLSFSEKY